MTPQPDRADEVEFFVGYLPMSARFKRVVLGLGLGGLLLLLAAGFALASTTHGAGPAKFTFAKSQGTLGVLTTEPTPVLWTLDPSLEHGVRGTLLVRSGKFGLSARARELAGKPVRVSGQSIERDGQRMIELAAEPQPVDGELTDAERTLLAGPVTRSLGEVTLRGEIEDSKCYLGRMRPGDERTHRACAQLCISGGIPALFVVREEHGTARQLLLADRQGHSIDRALLPYVAEPIEITGELRQLGNLWVLETSLDGVKRL
ncbi:MAG TPA: hypothetical protein VJR89_32955 [Polyangiales bacterium]|nr:hypothetical protein [Polyangiales bacterium]